jgi:AraC family transcriptional regulator
MDTRSSAGTAAVALRADVRSGDVSDAEVRVRVGAGHHDDVAAVPGCEADPGRRLQPRQAGSGAHVVIGERASQTVLTVVGQRAMQEVAVEDHGTAGRHLHRYGVGIAVWKGVSLGGAVETVIGLLTIGVDDAAAVRAGQHPQASVLDGRIIERDPGGGQRTVPGRDEHLVLVPRLPGLALALGEQHRLHGLDVRADDLVQRGHNGRMRQHLVHQRGQLVRKVDTYISPDQFVVGVARPRREEAVDRAQLPLADPKRLGPQCVNLATRQRVRQDGIPVLLILRKWEIHTSQPAAAPPPCPWRGDTKTWLIVISFNARLTYSRPAVGNYPPGTTYGPRTLRDFELVWMLVGTAVWRRLDMADELTLRPGTLLLLRPGMRDEFRWDPDSPCSHGYAHFGLDDARGSDRWPLHRPVTGPLEAWLSYLVWLGHGDAADDWIEQMLGIVVRTFVSGPLPPVHQPTEPPALRAALDYVRREWSRQVRAISVDELATAARVSRAHLSRLFQHAYGRGPATALEQVRLTRAEALLLRSNLSITAVGHAVGFTDPLHFSRRFRATHGLSPRAFRTAASSITGTTAAAPAGIALLAGRLDAAV